MGKTAAERRALLMSACPSMAIIHVGEKTTVISDVNRGDAIKPKVDCDRQRE